jgi:hypothetical protein
MMQRITETYNARTVAESIYAHREPFFDMALCRLGKDLSIEAKISSMAVMNTMAQRPGRERIRSMIIPTVAYITAPVMVVSSANAGFFRPSGSRRK